MAPLQPTPPPADSAPLTVPPQPPPSRKRAPGAVTAVAILLWIMAISDAIAQVLDIRSFLGTLPASADGRLVAAALAVPVMGFTAAVVLQATCAVMIRRGSRRWRRFTIVLLFLGIAASLYLLPLGIAYIALNGLCIYLLAGAPESREFFRGT